MSKKSYIFKMILFLAILSICFQISCDEIEPQGQYTKLLANRPDPNLDTLAQRSTPESTGGSGIDVFYDILKLRDVGNDKAVPVLEKIMENDNYSGRIHGFAAAQALFCIGTPEAHKTLSKYLLTDKYNAQLGINYTFHWEMNPSKGDDFIERYHLKNLSKDMAINLEVKPGQDNNSQEINFKITLTNISQNSYQIHDMDSNLGNLLYLRLEGGHFIKRLSPVQQLPPFGGPPRPNWIALAPGVSHVFEIPVYIRSKGKEKLVYRNRTDDSSTIILETDDMSWGLEKPGKYQVYAMLEQQKLDEGYKSWVGADKPWIGRIVSEPVSVDIKMEKAN